MTPELLSQIATIAGAVLTVMVFSYLLGDNFLYRLAIHILVGATAGFILITALESAILPWVRLTLLADPFDPGRALLGIVPFLIALLLLLKGSPRLSRLGDLGLVIILGVGTAIALWGAINGTLLPLMGATAEKFRPATIVDGFIVLLGTLSVLVYFTYAGVRRGIAERGIVEQILPVRFGGLVGKIFLMITLGATYALLIISALSIITSVIVERLLVLRGGL